jgi:hypothetical protein
MDSQHPEIPVGMYCYTVLEVIKEESGRPRLKTKVCPHWQKTENGARCSLLDREDHTYCGFHLIWDQVKECGINEGREEDYTPTTQEEHTARCVREGFELKTITCECGKEMEVWHKDNRKKKDGRTEE